MPIPIALVEDNPTFRRTQGAHIKNMYKRLHVHSRASLVRVAFEHRLLEDGPPSQLADAKHDEKRID